MIRIVECGQFKLAQCDGDSAENSTATFIRGQAPVLAAEIQRARAIYLRTKQVTGSTPTPEQILEQFPTIAECCVSRDVLTHVADPDQRTARIAALDILHGLFPTYSAEYIERSSRAPRRRSARMFSRFQVGKAGKAQESADTSASGKF
jgi:hypothetical protein